MPSKNMLPKGQRRRSVKAEYREQRTLANEREAALREARERGELPPEELQKQPASFDVLVAEEEAVPSQHVNVMSTRGPSGGKHPQEEFEVRRYENPYANLSSSEAPRDVPQLELEDAEDGVRSFVADVAAAGMRIDAYLAKALPDISRGRVQLLIENGQVTVGGVPAKAKMKLKGGEAIEIDGEPQPAPLNAVAEDIPLDVVYEDDDVAVVNKAAGMMVHAGSGAAEHNRGTLVNALLFRMQEVASERTVSSEQRTAKELALSSVGGDLRPGIVHRLDKQTSGLIVVAKNDSAHRKLSEMFADRRMKKIYIALVHGWMDDEAGTVSLPISRDLIRRIRMTTRRSGGRPAVSHWKVLEQLDGVYGKFSLLEVRIVTGRTHQIRVHMQALGHPVVGDTLYGAPHRIAKPNVEKRTGKSIPAVKDAVGGEVIELERNFLHAAELEFQHPRTQKMVALKAALPQELDDVLEMVRQTAS